MSAVPTQIGPYTIDREIGRGGMGVVYLSRDTKLDRPVAIKALPEHLAQDPDRLGRFEREARTLAQLSHSNVAGIYGVEEHDGHRYLVLEYVEGETLAERLDRGPLGVDEAIEIALQIASGVEAAHEAGVIHRDLKPANVKIDPDGRVKVLDFGLAKADEGASTSGSGMSHSPTLTSPAIQHSPTIAGAILGTAAYMSPEQARGRKVDKRTDIWSFGVTVYECLCGASPFVGETVSDSIGAILHKTVDLDRLPADAPPGVRRTLERCLMRDKNERWRDIGDVRLELAAARQAPDPQQASVRGRGSKLSWVMTGVLAAIATVAIWRMVVVVEPAGEPVHAQLMPPEGTVYQYRDGPPALSPDGRTIVFIAVDAEDQQHLWVRDLDKPTARRLAGTEHARYPFWSPNGESLAYFDDTHIRRIGLSGGPPDIICEAPDAWGGGAWNEDGVIVYASGMGGPLFKVPSSGGRPVQLTTLDRQTNEFRHAAPFFLPGGDRFLFVTRRGIGGENGVAICSLDGGPHRRVLDVDSNAVYVEPGYVLFWRDGALRAQRFDASSASASGDPFVVAPQTRFEPDDNMALFAASASGTLVYFHGQGATEKSRLELRDRTGTVMGTVGPDGNYYAPAFSRDGSRVAVDSSGVQNNGDIWVYGVSSPTAIRLTFDPADESRPVWSPDDRRIVFLSGKNGPDDLFAKLVNNPAIEETILTGDLYFEPTDWSPDGRVIAVNSSESDSTFQGDLWFLTVEDGEMTPLLESPFTTEDLRFSPDGEWCIYSSDETGQTEIYLQSLSDPANRRLVSPGGGRAPRWRGDGQELFYRAPDDMLMSVALVEGPGGPASTPVPLFEMISRFDFGASDYDVSPDGQQFIVNTAIRDDAPSPMSIIVNWSLTQTP